MDDKHIPILAMIAALLLGFVGCNLTGRSAMLPLPEPSSDEKHEIVSEAVPFRDPFLEHQFAKPPKIDDPFVQASVAPVIANKILEPPHETAPPVTKNEPEAPVLEEETYRASLEEQETVLAKDLWVRNILLERYLENGMKDPFPGAKSSADRRRSAQFDRLNLSDKELAKRDSRNSVEYISGLVSTWRWFHREMEQLASVPLKERADPKTFLKSPKYAGKNHKTLRANAAILLGRDGDPTVAELLIAVAGDKAYRPELRCAAVETLGKLPNVQAENLLPLLDAYKEKVSEVQHPQTGLLTKKAEAGVPLLWQETLHALAEKVEPWEHPCFMEPFSSKVYETRLAAAKLWRDRSRKATIPDDARLPDAFLEYVRQEGGELVRLELIKTLGAWKTPGLLDLVGADLHRTAALRGAALDALAESDCREALPMIRQRLLDLEGANRAQAVAALRKLGCYEDVFKMSKDADTKVKMEVAKAFAVQRNERSIGLAKQYLTENDARLQAATLDAVAAWPIEQQGILLLEAAKSPIPKIRGRAVETLTSHGIAVEGFNPDEKPESQAKKHEELVRRFNKAMAGRDFFETDSTADFPDEKAVSPNDPLLRDVRRSLDEWRQPAKSYDDRQAIRDRLLSLGDRLPIYLQYLYETERRNIPASLDSVLAEVDPIFEAIVLLDSNKSADFRKGAAELRRIAEIHGLESLAVRKILDRALRQSDTQVLATLLETLEHADPEAAKKLAETLLDTESVELRRKACAVFKEFGSEKDLDLVINLLYDPSPLLFRPALEAVVSIIDEYGAEESELAEIEKVLRNRLMQEEGAVQIVVQIDVAAALHRLGFSIGGETLRRLAASPENAVKVYVAKTVAVLEDPAFLPILFMYLDDRNGSVRKAALDGLPKLVGEDIGRIEYDHSFSTELSVTQQRVARWKNWYRQQP